MRDLESYFSKKIFLKGICKIIQSIYNSIHSSAIGRRVGIDVIRERHIYQMQGYLPLKLSRIFFSTLEENLKNSVGFLLFVGFYGQKPQKKAIKKKY